MKTASTNNNIPKQWWHLWNCTPCCLGKNKEVKREGESAKSFDKSEATREKILLAAFGEIYKRGFQAASLSNILQNTGTTLIPTGISPSNITSTSITKGALYHHFENKTELGYAVLDEVIRSTFHTIWIAPLENSDDPITTLTNIILQSGATMSEDDISLGCPLNNLAQEMSPIDEGFKIRISGIYQEWQDAIEASFERGKTAGTVRDIVDSKDIALLFIATLQGCMGFAKSVQKLDTLMACGKGLIDRLESLRPTK